MKLFKISILMVLLLLLTACPYPHPYPSNDSVNLLKNTEVTINILENDARTSVEFTLVITEQPLHGTITINDDKTITYKPSADYSGYDQFKYNLVTKKSDNSAIVSINVKESNYSPIANNDNYELEVGKSSYFLSVLDNDVDEDNDDLTIKIVSEPKNGRVYVRKEDTWLISYIPNKNFKGTDTFVYEVSDGINSSTATVTVNIK